MILIVISALLILAVIIGFLAAKNMNKNEQTITTPTSTIGTPTSTSASETTNQREEIVVDSPQANQKITSPLMIKGRARGSWFFEGQFRAILVDENNTKLGSAILKAEGEWTTNNFVPFSGELAFVNNASKAATLKLQSDNPSGLPENQKELLIPLSL